MVKVIFVFSIKFKLYKNVKFVEYTIKSIKIFFPEPLEDKKSLMVFQKYAFFLWNCKYDQVKHYKLKKKDRKQKFYSKVYKQFKARYDLIH